MRIVGKSHLDGNGVYLLTVAVRIQTGHPSWIVKRFLVDTGADRIVRCTAVLPSLGLPQQPSPVGVALASAGGAQGLVVVQTTREMVADANTPARIQGTWRRFWTRPQRIGA